MSVEKPAPTESLEQILIRRNRQKTPYLSIPTELEGINILALDEEGLTPPRLTVRETKRFASLAGLLASRREKSKRFSRLEQKTGGFIKDLARSHLGLRGVEIRDKNLRLPMHPQHSILWDRSELRETLGKSYPAVVGEKVNIAVLVQEGRNTPYGELSSELVKDAVLRGLGSLGLSEAELDLAVATEIELDVNEPRLVGMIQDGGLELPANVAKVSEQWVIDSPKPIKDH